MLYTRTSFITWLRDVKECDIITFDKNYVLIKNGVMKHYMGVDSKDRIDYEEIWIICTNLYIVGLPGDTDLVRIE